MDIYAPQTEIKSPWKEYSIMLFGFWLAGLGCLVWWADYILYFAKDTQVEWTSEQKQIGLKKLIEKAKYSGVEEITAEQKLRIMRGEPAE